MKSLFGKLAHRLNRSYVERGAVVKGKVHLGARTYIASGAQLIANEGGSITIGSDCSVLTGAIISCYGGDIVIGSRVGINPYAVLYGHGGLNIGDNVLIACHTVIIPANHNFGDLTLPIQDQGLTCKGIRIEEDVWLAAGVRVLDGVTIGKGSVVGAGSVVVRDLAPNGIYVGVPATLLRSRQERKTRE